MQSVNGIFGEPMGVSLGIMGKMKQIKMRVFPERDFGMGDVSLTMCGETTEFEVLGEAWHEIVRAGVAP